MDKVIYLFLAFAFAGINAVPVDRPSGRISNGVVAGNAVAFPYAVSIQLATAANLLLDTRGHMCGGVLITLQHVLTAGSCTYTWGTGNTMIPIVANQYRVFAGASMLTNDTTNHVRAVVNYTLHPEHLPVPAHLNDIAVMTLISPFGASFVTPLSLPSNDFYPSDETRCTVAGWGAPSYSATQMSSQLRYMTKYIYNQDLCRSLYNSAAGITNLLSSMVCAASYDIISSGCYGDEGNALVCGNTLTGISFLNGDCQVTSYPELYTRVSNYTTWIRSVTGSASVIKPGLFALALFTIVHAAVQKVFA
ncbi:granzyme M-like [Plodia interpunctella]|uniref:granzyme M-like n=1 Tax=Plodia interpunctella TaxID=58824 RepID=UPI002368915D|nr:granzyme M-like [Plodia interpunctella]